MKKALFIIFMAVFCFDAFSQELKTSVSFFTEQSIGVSFLENKKFSPEVRLYRSNLESLDFSLHLKYYIRKIDEQQKTAFYVGGGIKHRDELKLSIPVGIKYCVIPSNRNFRLITELITVTDFGTVEFIPNFGISYSF